MITLEEAKTLAMTIREEIDIAEMASGMTDLEYLNGELVGCCPIHKEDTPSFHINKEKNRYHCFGCLSGGDAISLYMAYHKMNFVDAVEKIATESGVVLTKKPAIVKEINRFKRNKCEKNQSTKLIEGCMDEFEKNHYIDEWVKEGISVKILEKYDVRYSCDKSRIVFPVLDSVGEIVSVKIRNLNTMPKYIYMNKIKGMDFFFNYYYAKDAICGLSECILLEGEKSVMKLEGWGVKNSVAVSSHNINDEQIKLLIRTPFKNLVFAYDSDVDFKEINKQAKKISMYKNVYYIPTKELPPKCSPVDCGYETWSMLYNKKIRIL